MAIITIHMRKNDGLEKKKKKNLTLPKNRSRSIQGHNLNNDGLESLMLHTKFRRNRSTGSGEEDF